MTLSHILLFIHILGVIIWLGAGITLEAMGWWVAQSGKRSALVDHIQLSSWVGPRIFMPSALATIIAGLLLVATGKPTFGQFWITVAIVGVVITALLGGTVVRKQSESLSTLIDKNGKEKEIENRYSRLTFFSRINFAVLLIILFDMVMKPKISDIWFFVVSIIFFLLVLGFSYSQYRKV